MVSRTVPVLIAALVVVLVGAADPQVYTAPDGKFSIAFPMKPTVTEKKAEPAPLKTFQDGNYGVIFMETAKLATLAPEGMEKELDDARTGLINSTRGMLLNDSKIKLNDKYLGRDVVVQLQDGKFLHARFYVVDDRFYGLTVLQTEDSLKNKKDAPFLDSFKVGKK